MSERLSVAEWRQRQDENRDARRQEMDARRESARDEHKAAIEAQQTEEVEPMDAGYEETLPGQIEVVAGTVQHEQVLNSFPNATSYGPDHNVVVPEPPPPPDPPPEGDPAAQQADPRVEPQWQREEEESGR